MTKKFVTDLDLPTLHKGELWTKFVQLRNDDGFVVLWRIKFNKFFRSIYPLAGDRKYAFFWSDNCVEGNEITDPELIEDLEKLWKKRAFNRSELWVRLE